MDDESNEAGVPPKIFNELFLEKARSDSGIPERAMWEYLRVRAELIAPGAELSEFTFNGSAAERGVAIGFVITDKATKKSVKVAKGWTEKQLVESTMPITYFLEQELAKALKRLQAEVIG